MEIILDIRTERHVEIYFEKAKNDLIRRMLPQKAATVAEAIADYRQTLLPGATSYGRIILADGNYVGDVWCYCMDANETPNTMISYCIFEPEYWNLGIATEAVRMFISDIHKKYHFKTIGAFTFSDNVSSIRVLEKNGFEMMEEFLEDGIRSKYFELDIES